MIINHHHYLFYYSSVFKYCWLLTSIQLHTCRLAPTKSNLFILIHPHLTAWIKHPNVIRFKDVKDFTSMHFVPFNTKQGIKTQLSYSHIITAIITMVYLVVVRNPKPIPIQVAAVAVATEMRIETPMCTKVQHWYTVHQWQVHCWEKYMVSTLNLL